MHNSSQETVSGTSPIEQSGFAGLGIAPKILEALNSNKFTTPTPIQKQAIPVAVEGKDVIGIAQTGTGKTLAFSLPMLQRLAQVQGRALVILPTRELALQVEETLLRVGKILGLRTAMLIGGASMGRQIQMLRNKPHVIVGTPGRIIDHLEQKTLSLKEVKILVLDEADRMLDMGFWPQISRILEVIPKERQTMLFSATMPKEIVTMAMKEMKQPIRIEVAPAGTTAEKVAQELFVVKRDEKNRLLDALLKEQKGSVLVFSRTKFAARRLAFMLTRMGYSAADIHSDRTLAQRRAALEGFKNGKYRVLVATDIAARGIDVAGIALVINYDLPDNPDDYVHRIGRTARAGRDGKAVSFVSPDQKHVVRDIERLVRRTIPVSVLPELPADRSGDMGRSGGFREERGGSRGGFHGGRGFDRGPRREGGFGGEKRGFGGGRGGRPGFRKGRSGQRHGGGQPTGGYFFGPAAV
jgi:ATP-dependent RNA helicase RhlE